MLHLEAIEPRTFSLLKRLMILPSLHSFSLVGGTALSLRYGHRTSIDLDLFHHEKFDNSLIENELIHEFASDFTYESRSGKLGIFCFLKNIKVDIVYYPHIPVSSPEVESGIRMYSSADLAAMKIQAILGRAMKKDFWDLFELLQHFPLHQLIEWHKKKYPSQMLAISIPSALTYFQEAEESETPLSLKNQTWNNVKKGIQAAVSDYLR
jgi:hypothetical protein